MILDIDEFNIYIGIFMNKPVHELVVPIAYASSEGSDEPSAEKSSAPANCPHTHRRNEDEGTFLNQRPR